MVSPNAPCYVSSPFTLAARSAGAAALNDKKIKRAAGSDTVVISTTTWKRAVVGVTSGRQGWEGSAKHFHTGVTIPLFRASL